MAFILVTGASGDIGAACARDLAAKGYSLYCHYFSNQTRMDALIEELTLAYPKQDFLPLQCDLRQIDSLSIIQEQLFQLEGIVFAHGHTTYKLITDTTPSEIDDLWCSQLKLPIMLCQALQSTLTQNSFSSIVFISSVYGLIGSAMEVMYSTIKGGQLAFVKAYAQEVASLQLTVNAVAPGAVETQMNLDWSTEEKNELLSDIPLHRMAQPEEIASLVSYLISKDARYITGTVIPVSGGWKI